MPRDAFTRQFAPDEIAAMRAFDLDPGHSDLDDEQPMSVPVGSEWVRCQLGDIRKAKRDAYAISKAARLS